MERFIIQPSIKLFGGITVKEDTAFKEKATDVEQELKNCILTTVVKRELDLQGIKTTEDTKLTQVIPVGTRLIWSEQEGYIISPYKMYTVEEAIEELNCIKE